VGEGEGDRSTNQLNQALWRDWAQPSGYLKKSPSGHPGCELTASITNPAKHPQAASRPASQLASPPVNLRSCSQQGPTRIAIGLPSASVSEQCVLHRSLERPSGQYFCSRRFDRRFDVLRREETRSVTSKHAFKVNVKPGHRSFAGETRLRMPRLEGVPRLSRRRPWNLSPRSLSKLFKNTSGNHAEKCQQIDL
jgi:hypothetical protein